MIRAILWKEWHENRSRFASYWLVLNVPIIVVSLAIAISKTARVPFADLSETTVWKYLPLSLLESFLLETVLTLAAAYLAVAIFSHEIEDRSLFFLFEQPVPRKKYVAIKFLNGALHVVLATYFAALLAPAVVYAMMLFSGKVTTANSGTAFAAVMAVSVRTGSWCSVMAFMVFTASALVSALVPRFWMAATISVVLLTLFGLYSGDFFDIPAPTGEPISVSGNLTTGNAQWITISRALKPAELAGFAHWQSFPLLSAALLATVFCVATALLYDRKQLK